MEIKKGSRSIATHESQDLAQHKLIHYTYTYTFISIYFSITNSSTRSSVSQPQ